MRPASGIAVSAIYIFITMKNYRVLLFYKYVNVVNPALFADNHLKWCVQNDIKGRVFVAKEGINGTVSGAIENIEKYKTSLTNYPEFKDIVFKEDDERQHAFSAIHVRLKDEIVNSGLKTISQGNGGKRLSPAQLFEFYKTGEDFIIVDVRNSYESKIGKFKDAVTPQMQNFRQWPSAVETLKEFKDKKIVTYCTGGIRCEKASAYLIEQGFKDVYQFEGGIVSFTKKYPDTYWFGGVFVFDERRIIEPNTNPALKYISNCYFCGTPAAYYINCHNLDCDKIIVSCHKCKIDNNYCCSDECRNASNKRNKYYG
jgi:UPF0176 protein